ncbi:MAG: ferrous iron transport protein B [Desulfobacterales bacterium]
MDARPLTIALAGNPNSGKTSVFNNLTGTRQKVGNWPGVTVEKKEGHIRRGGREITIVDLPGTYSLTPFSLEEVIARNYLLDERPDVVVVVIDATNLERSLYLATQIRELDGKVLFALNMADMARARGLVIDAAKLSQLLDVPVVFTVANRAEGMEELLEQAIRLADSPKPPDRSRRVKYSRDLEEAIGRLAGFLESRIGQRLAWLPRWTAIKLLEDDEVVKQRLVAAAPEAAGFVLEAAAKLRRHLAERYDEDPQIVLTDERYGFIAGIVREVQRADARRRVDVSRNIDLVLTHRFLGFPIFLFFIWAMFQLTFTLGEAPVAWIEDGVGWAAEAAAALLPAGPLQGLIVDGVIAGVGSVLKFLPNILILFFCIALFEDTGYMARTAFLMDRIMHLIGLHGKSFIPMLMGFGCNVPAVMAARTLESPRDRILTILITPFMSCSAKLPVYVVLAGAFFGERAGSVIFALYLLGILLSILTGRLLRSTLLAGADAPFVMELPPYRMPMVKSLLIHMWDRSRIFLRKMGNVILVGSVVVWVLSSFPQVPVEGPAAGGSPPAEAAGHAGEARGAQIRESWLGRIGRAVEPLFAPLGIDWRGAVALLSGFIAKEIVVSTLGVLHAVGEASESGGDLERALLSSGMSPLSGLSMMVFVLLYLPCLATVSAIRRETGSTKWMLFSIGYNTSVAWLVSFAVYQGGRLLGYA